MKKGKRQMYLWSWAGKKLLALVFLTGTATPLGAWGSASQNQSNFFSRAFSLELPREPERPRNYIIPPIMSAIFPGFDQWFEGQWEGASLYSGVALGGLVLQSSARRVMWEDLSQSHWEDDIFSRNSHVRQFLLGSQIYMAAGSFSAYHSFRSAVRSRQAQGQFAFLAEEETVDELLLAPFRFGYLRRSTTWIPLVVAGGLVALNFSDYPQLFSGNGFGPSDVFYGGAYSYLAGTHEEALFRGWMMPVLMQSWNSPFWSNTVTSAAFALAHLGSVGLDVPWPQFIAGWYLGYLTQKNNWTLGESVFVHTWWDVIVITAAFAIEARDKSREVKVNLPLLNFSY